MIRGSAALGRHLRWAVLALCLAGGAGADPTAPLREPGERLPELSLRDVEGRVHRLGGADRTGPILLFFWSVYCPNCKEAMPRLVSLWESARARGLSVWAINVDGERFSNGVRAYLREVPLPFPVLYDRLEGDTLIAADPLGVSKTPTLYLADADGVIVLRQVIHMDFAALRQTLTRPEP